MHFWFTICFLSWMINIDKMRSQWMGKHDWTSTDSLDTSLSWLVVTINVCCNCRREIENLSCPSGHLPHRSSGWWWSWEPLRMMTFVCHWHWHQSFSFLIVIRCMSLLQVDGVNTTTDCSKPLAFNFNIPYLFILDGKILNSWW